MRSRSPGVRAADFRSVLGCWHVRIDADAIGAHIRNRDRIAKIDHRLDGATGAEIREIFETINPGR